MYRVPRCPFTVHHRQQMAALAFMTCQSSGISCVQNKSCGIIYRSSLTEGHGYPCIAGIDHCFTHTEAFTKETGSRIRSGLNFLSENYI